MMPRQQAVAGAGEALPSGNVVTPYLLRAARARVLLLVQAASALSECIVFGLVAAMVCR